ncbi:MAG: arylsulfatase, partial [Planctomycetaceae bacterium]|nr:arylsulfatase [Planctomycetaceae bacterium]
MLLFSSTGVVAADSIRPNVLLIMADDLGYSDLGCYGGEIATPNLDSLAAGGLRFTQFYNTARCWPTRAALLTGYYAQQVRRDVLPGVKNSGGGNRGTRPVWAPLVPQLLKSTGYHCYHSGKWHLDGKQLEGGFDHSYHLADQGRFFSPNSHFRDDVKLPAVERDTGFYGTTAIADHCVEVLTEHFRDYGDQPFFHYLAFTAPHFPLHALPEDIAKYSQRYQVGWDQIRSERYARQREIGLLPGVELSADERDLGPPYDFPDAFTKLGPGEVKHPLPWNELNAEQQQFQATKMSLHAAMIDRMDQEIGRVLTLLRERDAIENTLILFLSDNGASAEIMVRADGHDPTASPGSAASYLCLGPGWSTSSNTPFRRHKTWVHEGGISTPLIAHWPARIKNAGEFRRTVGHVIDIVPTILEIAGAAVPTEFEGVAVPVPPGRSLVPAFTEEVELRDKPLWWLHEGNRAFRTAKWKLVAAEGEPWELYAADDRAEQHNLADRHPK